MNISGVQAGSNILTMQGLSSKKAKEDTQTESAPSSAQVDTYSHQEAGESAGIYHPTGNQGVAFDAPAQQASAGASTDSDTDDTLEELEEQRDELEEQLEQATDPAEQERLQKELQLVEQQIAVYQSQSSQEQQ